MITNPPKSVVIYNQDMNSSNSTVKKEQNKLNILLLCIQKNNVLSTGIEKKREIVCLGSAIEDGGSDGGSKPVNARSATNWTNNWRQLNTR
jgi:hypothetical protein